MLKQKILLVARSFYPVNSPRSFRATELAKGFSRMGHEVTILTSRNETEHPAFEKLHGVTIKNLGQPSWKPITLKKGFLKWYYRGLRRVLGLFFLYPELEWMGKVKRALKKERDYGYDMLISIAVPYAVHFGVAKARTRTHPMATVWIADCGDPFMGQENDSFRYPFYFKYVEKWFCRKADYLTIPIVGAVQAYYPEFRKKIKVIPQGFNFNELELPKYKGPNPVPTFAYAGGLIPGRRDPRELLEYLCSLPGDYRFHLYTQNHSLVKPFATKSQGRIIVHDPIPRAELLPLLSQMDFLVNLENVGQKQLPSKLIDYALVDRPVLSIKTGALPQTVLDEFMVGEYAQQFQIGSLEAYRIERVCQDFLNLNNYELPLETPVYEPESENL